MKKNSANLLLPPKKHPHGKPLVASTSLIDRKRRAKEEVLGDFKKQEISYDPKDEEEEQKDFIYPPTFRQKARECSRMLQARYRVKYGNAKAEEKVPSLLQFAADIIEKFFGKQEATALLLHSQGQDWEHKINER